MSPKRPRPAWQLLCLDVQTSFLGVISDAPRLLRRCGFAISTASLLDVPVAFTEQVPQKLGTTVSDLKALAPKAPAWGKVTFSALADDGIRDAVRKSDADHLLICGIETPVCVYQTAIDALDQQYQVTVLADAVDARRPDDAALVLAELRRAGVHVLPSETVFYAGLHDARHPSFRDYTALVKKYGQAEAK